MNQNKQNKTKKSLGRLLAFALVLCMSGSAWAQFTTTNAMASVISGSSLSAPNSDYSPATVTGITLSSVTKTVGAASGASGRLSASGWGSGAANGEATFNIATFSNVNYFEFSVTPNVNYSLDITSISFDGQRSATGPRNFSVRSNADSYGSNLPGTTFGANTSDQAGVCWFTSDIGVANNVGFALSGPNFTGISAIRTFRVYVWRSEATGGTFSLDNINIQGTATFTGPTTNYYSKSTGNLDLTATWGLNNDGSGAAPVDFVTDGQIFNVVNNATPTIGANWTVSGSGCKIIIGDGIANINYTAPATFTTTGVVDVLNNATITLNNPTLPTFSTIGSSSTLNFNSSTGTQTIPAIGYGNLSLTGSSTKDIAGVFSVAGNLNLNAPLDKSVAGFVDELFGGNITIGGSTTYSAAFKTNVNFVTSGNGVQSISGSGNTLQCGRLRSDSKTSGSLTLGANTNVTLTSNVMLNFQGSSTFDDGGNTISSGSMIYMDGASASNYTLTGTIVAATTVAASNIANSVSNGPIVAVLNNLTINSSGAGTMTVQPTGGLGTININGNLTINSVAGAFSTAGTMNLKGNYNNTTATAVTAGTSSNIVFNGTGAQSFSTSATEAFKGLTVNKVSGTLTLNNNLQCTTGGTFTLQAGTVAGSGTITAPIVNLQAGTMSAVIAGTSAVTKTTAATVTLASTNTYTGTTTVSAGNLVLSGSTASGSAVTVAGGTLKGSGTVNGTFAVNSNGIIAPGNSPGITNVGATTFNSGGNYLFEINNATGSEGVNWDLLNVSGILDIQSTNALPFTITLSDLGGVVANFDNTQPFFWTIAATPSLVANFASNKFAVNSSGFVVNNPLAGGTFSLGLADFNTNLVLQFFPSSVPAVLASVSSLACGTSSVNVDGPEFTFDISGTNLDGSDVTVTAPADFLISDVMGGPYTNILTFTDFSGNYSSPDLTTTPIYVVVNSSTVGAKSGDLTISGGGDPTDATVNLTGSVIAAEPSTIGTITFGTTTSSSAVVNFTSGNGAKRILVVRQGSAVNSNPVDGTVYTASATFGSGAQLGTGNYVAYIGTGNTVTVNGLSASTTYHFAVYELNDGGVPAAANYLTSTFATANKTTFAGGPVYYWTNGFGDNNFSQFNNWSPSRITPSVADVLVFSGISGSIIGVQNEFISQLVFTNNSNIILAANAINRTISVSGDASASTIDFIIDAGSSFSTAGSLQVNIALGAAAKGEVYGSIAMNIAGTTVTAATAGALHFKSGSSVTTGATFSGSAFGNSGTANTVIFESGATYTQTFGSNPFGLGAPASKVTFQTGSNYIYGQVGTIGMSNRSFANVTINTAAGTPSNSGTLNIQNLTIGAAGSLILTNTGIVNISGNITSNSNIATALSVTSVSGNINFNKSGTQTIGGSGTGAITFSPVAGAGTATVATGTTLTINKNLTFNSLVLNGNLKFNVAALTATLNGSISGSGLIYPFGNWDCSLNFQTPAAGSVGVLNIYNSNIRAINNLTINRTAGLTLASALNVFGTVTVTSGAITSNGFMTLKSNATTQGIISGAGTADVQGNVTVERYVATAPYDSYHYLSCPVAGQTVASAWGDDFPVLGQYPYVYSPLNTDPQPTPFPSVWTYNETNTNVNDAYSWESANGPAVLAPLDGVAARVMLNSAFTIDVTGVPNNGTVTKPLTKTAGDGVQMVGNPYPCPISFSSMVTSNGPANFTGGYYAYSPIYYQYGYYTGGPTGTFGTTNTIYPSQAFFITAANPFTLTLNNSNRLNSNAPTFFSEETETALDLVKLNITNGDKIDQLAIYALENGNDGYNVARDANKIFPPNDVNPAIYSIVNDKKLAIKEFKTLAGKQVIIGVKVPTDGIYTFTAAELANLTEGTDVYFVDAEKNITKKLAVGESYTTSLNEGEYTSRFYLNYKASNATGLNNVNVASEVDVYMNNNVLSIANNNEAKLLNIEVYDVAGRNVYSNNTRVNSGVTTLNLGIESNGVYFVKVKGNNCNINKKVVVK